MPAAALLVTVVSDAHRIDCDDEAPVCPDIECCCSPRDDPTTVTCIAPVDGMLLGATLLTTTPSRVNADSSVACRLATVTTGTPRHTPLDTRVVIALSDTHDVLSEALPMLVTRARVV
jgi:hypothetical protein